MMILSPTNQPPTRAILITVIVVRNTTGRRSIVLGSCVRAYIPKLSVPFEHVATGKEASIGTAGCATYAMLCYAMPCRCWCQCLQMAGQRVFVGGRIHEEMDLTRTTPPGLDIGEVGILCTVHCIRLLGNHLSLSLSLTHTHT